MIGVTIWALTVCAGVLVVWALMCPQYLGNTLKTNIVRIAFYRATAHYLGLLSVFAIAASALGSMLVASCDTLR